MALRSGIAMILAMAGLCASARGQDGVKVNGFDVIGIGGAGGMFCPSASPYDPNLMLVCSDMSGCYRSTDGGKRWEMIPYRQISNSIECRPFFVKDAILWAGAAGLEISRDKGVTWQLLVQAPPWKATIRKIVGLDPAAGQDPKALVIFVGTDEGLWHSPDGGGKWEKSLAGKCFDVVTVGGKVFASVGQGFHVSADRGNSWVQIAVPELKGQPMMALAGGMDRNGSCLFASAWGVGVLRSTDEGKTWRVVVDKFDDQNIFAMSSNQTKVAYAAQSNAGWCRKIWRTTNGGESWEQCFSMSGANKNVELSWVQTELSWDYYVTLNGLGVCPSDPNVVMVSTQGDFYISRDGAATWKQIINIPTEVEEDGKRVRRYKPNGLEVTVSSGYLISPHNPKDHYIQYQDIGFARSRDGGATWAWSAKGCPWVNTFYAVVFDPFVKDRMYAACSRKHMIPDWTAIGTESRETAGGICVSDDGGSTWSVLGKGLPLAPATGFVIDPRSTPEKVTMYAGMYDSGVYKSTDGGKTWADKSKGLGNAGNLHVCRLYVNPRSGNLYCLITGSRDGRDFKVPGGVWRSTDSGESWQDLTAGLKLAWPTDVAVSDDEKTMIVSAATTPVHQQGGAYRSTDGGKTWERTFSDKDAAKWIPPGYVHALTVRFHPDQPGLVYLGTYHGLWYSKDAGKSWQVYEQVPFKGICALCFDPANTKRMYVCTYGVSVLGGPYLP